MNAALALATIRILQPVIPVSAQAIREGLTALNWPGRLQSIRRPGGQSVLLDGAHNTGGAQVLAAAWRENTAFAGATLILGILQDKDWEEMCGILAPLAGKILLVPVHSERTQDPHGLGEACRKANPQAEVVEFQSLSEALQFAASDARLVIAGSLYLVGEALELFGLSANSGLAERGLNEWTVLP